MFSLAHTLEVEQDSLVGSHSDSPTGNYSNRPSARAIAVVIALTFGTVLIVAACGGHTLLTPSSSLGSALTLATVPIYSLSDTCDKCPDKYFPLASEDACDAWSISDSNSDPHYTKNPAYDQSTPGDPHGCFVYSYEQGGTHNDLYYNTDATSTIAGGHCEGRQLVCALNEYSGFTGTWKYVGQGTTLTLTEGTSWSNADADMKSDSWATTLSASYNAKFGVPGVATAELTVSASETYTHSSSETITETKGGSETVSCASVDCSNGNLYQWNMVGTRDPVYVKEGEDAEDYVRQCSFVCVPSSLPGDSIPLCPEKWCGDVDQGCQCCNSNGWAEDPTADDLPPICTSSSGEGGHGPILGGVQKKGGKGGKGRQEASD